MSAFVAYLRARPDSTDTESTRAVVEASRGLNSVVTFSVGLVSRQAKLVA